MDYELTTFEKEKMYKFRCECHADVIELKKALGEKMTNVKVQEKYSLFSVEIIPDEIVTFESDIPLKQLRQLFGKVKDAHVAAETLQLIEHYTGEIWNTKRSDRCAIN